MRIVWPFCFIFSNKHFHVLDKEHVKTYANSWIDIWKSHTNPLSELRINEAWKSIIWCSKNNHNHNSHCLMYKHNNYMIFVEEKFKTNTLHVLGILESPENSYASSQIHTIHDNLLDISNQTNYRLDYSLMRDWSHGFYFYEHQNTSEPVL